MLLIIFLTTLLGGIIQLPPATQAPPPPSEEFSYKQLDCTNEEREHIGYIINTMAENGKLSLLFQYKGELTVRGEKIAHVHPLKFLAVIFSDPNLKESMKKLFPDYFKRTRLMNDLTKSLEHQMDLGQVEPYLDGFAKEVSAPIDLIKGYAQSRDWDGLMEFLLNH